MEYDERLSVLPDSTHFFGLDVFCLKTPLNWSVSASLLKHLLGQEDTMQLLSQLSVAIEDFTISEANPDPDIVHT